MAATAEIKAVITAEDNASDVVSKFGQNIGAIGGSLLVAGAAMTAFGVMAVNSFNESEAVGAQLNAVLKSTGGIAGVTADEVNGLASALQKTTRFSDEQIGVAQNMLLTFTKIGKDIFPDTTKAVLDMATAMGTDLKSTSIQVGKALQDPVRGVTALQRVGVRLTDAQKDLVQSLVDVGDVAGAQKIILQELQTEFGGSAEAAGKTFAGQLDIARNALDNIMEQVGQVIANALQPFVEKIQPVVDKIQEWIDKNPQLVTAIVGIGAAIAVATVAVGALMIAFAGLNAVASPWLLIAAAIVAGIALVAVGVNWLVGTFGGWEEVWKNITNIYNAYIKPALMDLWSTIQTQLIPVLQEFWDKNKNWIIPALQALAIVIGVVILGSIMVFIGAIKLVVQAISWLGQGFTWVVEQIKNGIAFVVDRANYLKNNFWEVIGSILGFFATLPIKIPFFIASAIMWVVNYIRNIDWGGIWNTIYNALTNMLSKIPSAFMNMINGIRNLDWGSIGKSIANAVLGFMEGAINGAFAGLPGAPKVRLPRFARGVENFGGGLAIVGERGPELVNLPKGSDVIPNNQIATTGGGSTTININVGLMTGSAIERREAAMKMFEDLQDIASQRGQTVGQLIGA